MACHPYQKEHHHQTSQSTMAATGLQGTFDVSVATSWETISHPNVSHCIGVAEFAMTPGMPQIVVPFGLLTPTFRVNPKGAQPNPNQPTQQALLLVNPGVEVAILMIVSCRHAVSFHALVAKDQRDIPTPSAIVGTVK